MKNKVLFKDLRLNSRCIPLSTLTQNLGVDVKNELLLDNKYYSALLGCITHADDDARRIVIGSDHSYDAAILFVDSSEGGVLKEVSKHLEACSNGSVSVLVVADMCLTKEASLCRQELEKLCWSLQAEYTLMHGPLEMPTFTQSSILADEDGDEEMSGYCRIRDALEAHMWECMKLKEDNGDADDDDDDVDNLKGNQQVKDEVQEKGCDKQKGAIDERTSTILQEINSKKVPTIEDDFPFISNMPTPMTTDPLVDNIIQGLLRMGQDPTDCDDESDSMEDDVYAFETLVNQMKGLRSSVQSKSDEQRRDMAEKVALAFANAFCCDDDGEDEVAASEESNFINNDTNEEMKE
eukprot:m.78948 g.78948  ORF g.78948 m.78948 type:complete len:351 (-) comp8589_c3_seq2:3173-4225(-)